MRSIETARADEQGGPGGGVGPQPPVPEDACPYPGGRSRGYENRSSLFKLWILGLAMFILVTWAAVINVDMFHDFGDVVTMRHTSPRSMAEADGSSRAHAFAPNGKFNYGMEPCDTFRMSKV